ncbi:MAG: hypothetical protein WD492_12760 [Alkalispirochaeta sp.]
MREYTNKHGLPGAIVEAVKNDDYDPGESDITATSMIKPPQLRQLEKRYENEIVEDVSDRLWMLMGKAVHKLLETTEPSSIVETRLYATVDPDTGRIEPGPHAFAGGVTVGGQFDRMTLRRATLQDYKFTSVWEVIMGLKPEREQQLNILAELAHQNGYTGIRRLEIVHLGRDWQRSKSLQGGDYPAVPMNRMSVPLRTPEERQAFILERVRVHAHAEALADSELPECTDEERWKNPAKYAIRKKGRKSAISGGVCDTRGEAEAKLSELDSQHWIEERASEPKRCSQGYCPVRDFCWQWQTESTGEPPRAQNAADEILHLEMQALRRETLAGALGDGGRG